MTSNQIPALLTGIVLGLYWARVLRMAHKTRRRTGNAANLLPPEPLGRLLRILWFPAVGLWIASPFLSIAIPTAWTTPMPTPPALSYSAASIVLACLVTSWICWKRMGKAWRMGINPDETTQLVVTGPYAYVRHPIYAISTVMAAASALAVPSAVMLTATLVHIVLLQWESRREEQHMLRTHGEVYRTYCQSVGRFVPRLW
jgi:protein-S-isoprenylcysteine O-methyltransferase Ste14